MAKNFSSMYKEIQKDSFPKGMEISFFDEENRQTLRYERVEWDIDGEKKGLRYGENPDQEAGLYKLVNGNLVLGEVECLQGGHPLASEPVLLQSGKHPSKINLTDADAALNILRYFQDKDATVIIKHNNPCGVALGESQLESFVKAYMADRVAAFGGCVAVNRTLDLETTRLILDSYFEVVVAPDFAPGVMDLLKTKPNIRVMLIKNMTKLQTYIGKRTLDFKSLMDGGVVVQWSFVPKGLTPADYLPAETTHKGITYKVDRQPTKEEMDDIIFGWLVESGVTSNSVIYVKNGATVGIGTGEQDRVGVAEIARDKAYRKLEDRLCWERYKTAFNTMEDEKIRQQIQDEVKEKKGGIPGSIMVSDAFFPFRDGIDVGLKEGVSAVVQPGGSIRDWEVIQACNEAKAAMVFTGQRSFRH